MEYFRTKNPNFWYEILEGLGIKRFDLSQDLLVYFIGLWYMLQTFGIFWSLGIFFLILVHCTMEDLATLVASAQKWEKESKRRNHFLESCSLTLFGSLTFPSIVFGRYLLMHGSLEAKQQCTKKLKLISSKVARWYVFKPKIPLWGKFWYILWPFGIY
jgi:hypothetical protein